MPPPHIGWTKIGLISILLSMAGCTGSAEVGSTLLPTAPFSVRTETLTQTQAATSTPALITPPPPQGSASIHSMVSPNGEWIAQTSFEQPGAQYHVQLKVLHKDGSITWTLVDYWQSGLGYAMPQLQHWSHDSRYFYSSERWLADGGCEFFSIDSSWQKLDVQTGETTDLHLPLGRGHAISPDDLSLAYVSADTPLYLHLHNVQTGEEQSVLVPGQGAGAAKAEAGSIVWSPAGDAVILATVGGEVCGSSERDFSLVRVEIPSLEPSELIAKSRDFLRPLKWILPNHVLLIDWNGCSWWIDAGNGQPTTSPETPGP